ncbi:hypothetical protein MRS44_012000 [Fusarium solani]|uniref:uncharacterized protein n=1 Tax=Fusarium solani TaxID=169388 RepID=UPI0032C41926|nr:hypothetical protein MRS44_012000 [Fusarium solani]
MVFTSPAWVPKLPFSPPDSIAIAEFLNNDKYGRNPISRSRNPYTCGLSGKTFTTHEVLQREEYLSRAIAQRLGYVGLEGTEWDRVVCLFSLNTVDYIPLAHAIHRISGIVTPASAAYSAAELEHQLRSSGANALFTCIPLLPTALAAARGVGIPDTRIFILPLTGFEDHVPYKTVDDLVEEGRALLELPPLNWSAGEGARRVAYKGVLISHHNVISCIMMLELFNQAGRKATGAETRVGLGLLPFSHIFGLVVCGLYTLRNGDELIVLPRFQLKSLLGAIQRFHIEQLAVVPPIIIEILRNRELCSSYDLSSVRVLGSGAAPLGEETIEEIHKVYPTWSLCQGYGLTETSSGVTVTSELDTMPGSSGSLLPGVRAKIIDAQGNEVMDYEKPGELLVQGPLVVLGYLNDVRATASSFVHHDDGRWMRTGDEVLVRKSPRGNDHFVVTDRIKELIKVNGHQVAPAELEAHLLTHRFVADCAVIQVPDARAGEAPKAFVVKTADAGNESDREVAFHINKHVQDHKARHKWLKGGIEFIDEIPKSSSGKILRRILRDREKKVKMAQRAKL